MPRGQRRRNLEVADAVVPYHFFRGGSGCCLVAVPPNDINAFSRWYLSRVEAFLHDTPSPVHEIGAIPGPASTRDFDIGPRRLQGAGECEHLLSEVRIQGLN